MKPFPHGPGHLICRHWNGSPVELGMTKRFFAAPGSERLHPQPYHEFSGVLEGRATLEVEGQSLPLRAGTTLMAAPGEPHRISHVDPDVGVRWTIIRERSQPRSRVVVPPEPRL